MFGEDSILNLSFTYFIEKIQIDTNTRYSELSLILNTRNFNVKMQLYLNDYIINTEWGFNLIYVLFTNMHKFSRTVYIWHNLKEKNHLFEGKFILGINMWWNSNAPRWLWPLPLIKLSISLSDTIHRQPNTFMALVWTQLNFIAGNCPH